jgi:outer membrane biosynthesis protein TonB
MTRSPRTAALRFCLLVAGSCHVAGCDNEPPRVPVQQTEPPAPLASPSPPTVAAPPAPADPTAPPAPVGSPSPPANLSILPGLIGATAPSSPEGAPDSNVRKLGDPSLDQKVCPPVGMPPYPQKALHARAEAHVVARCLVEVNGTLNCTLLKSDPLFDEPILSALAKARVQPFTAQGEPVRVFCNYPFRYKIH